MQVVVSAVKELAGLTTIQVHLYTEWNTYPSSLPRLDEEIASYATAGEHVDLALVDATPVEVASNPQGFAAFVAAMVAHFAGQHAVTWIQVTNESNNPFTATAEVYGQTPIAALVAGIEAGSAAKKETGSRAALGFNLFSSFGSVNDTVWWKSLGAAGGKRFAADVQWVGIDLYPGTYIPHTLPAPGSGHLANIAATDVAQAVDNLRTNLMPLAGLGSHVPMGISEIGWATSLPTRSLAEQAELVKAFTAGACSVAVRDNLSFMTWFELANNPVPTRATPFDEGLMDAALTPQPGFVAYQNAIRYGCPVSGAVQP